MHPVCPGPACQSHVLKKNPRHSGAVRQIQFRYLIPLVCFHIRDKSGHGISDSCESLSMALAREERPHRLRNGPSCACSTDSGQIQVQGNSMLFVPPASGGQGSYKRVKGKRHTVEKRKAIHPQKPHATSQPLRFSHTPRLSTDAANN